MLIIDGRQRTLAKEMNVLLGQAEKVVLPKVPTRVGVGCLTRHDEIRNRLPVSLRKGQYLSTQPVEQSSVRHRPNRIHPLGGIEAQSSPLATGDKNTRHSPFLKQFLSDLGRRLPSIAFFGSFWQTEEG